MLEFVLNFGNSTWYEFKYYDQFTYEEDIDKLGVWIHGCYNLRDQDYNIVENFDFKFLLFYNKTNDLIYFNFDDLYIGSSVPLYYIRLIDAKIRHDIKEKVKEFILIPD